MVDIPGYTNPKHGYRVQVINVQYVVQYRFAELLLIFSMYCTVIPPSAISLHTRCATCKRCTNLWSMRLARQHSENSSVAQPLIGIKRHILTEFSVKLGL